MEKRDLKAITTLTLFSSVENAKQDGRIGLNDKIIFVTSFGLVTASKVISGKFNEDALTNENYGRFTLQTVVNLAQEYLLENNNGDILDTQTAFVLEDVSIVNGNNTTNLPIMILFADEIAGLSFGGPRQ